MKRPLTAVKVTGAGGPPVVKGLVAAHATSHSHDTIEPNAFAPLRQNNEVKFFTTGKAYFETVCAAMLEAESSIFIAGWQVNWDVELVPGKRLLDVLHNRVQSSDSFRVFVMPWMSPKIGLDTFDLETMLAIFHLNAGRKSMQAMCCPAGAQSDLIGTEGAAFSHHQKLVVIDNKLAYVGGIDLAYGRLDDERFTLNSEKRQLKERYNPGIPPLKEVGPGDGKFISMMDLLKTTLTAGRWNVGGNSALATKTEPSAIDTYLAERMKEAEKLALDAVAVVNSGIALHRNAYNKLVRDGKATIKAAANGVADTAISASRAVSAQCAEWRVPDLYGKVNGYKVNPNATSGASNALRARETDAVDTFNRTVAGASAFLEPLARLQVDPNTRSVIPDLMDGIERRWRPVQNRVVDGVANVAGTVQRGAEDSRAVCVRIAPTVERNVAEAKKNVRAVQQHLVQTANSIDASIAHGINVVQGSVIDTINSARRELNEKVLQAIEAGDKFVDGTIRELSQEKLESVLREFMRLGKVVYLAQIALSWADVKPHKELLDPRTKSCVGGGFIIGPTQPRQPWQDVHSEIKGPAVADVARNFIDRWNAAQVSYLRDETIQDLLSAVGLIAGPVKKLMIEGAAHVVSKAAGPALRKNMMIPQNLVPPRIDPNPKADGTGAAVRILRSAPRRLCRDEAKGRGEKNLPAAAQSEIHAQMVELILHATDFIYIENQFFQSEFGQPSISPFTEESERLTSGPMKLMYSGRMNRIKSELSSAGHAPNKSTLPANEIGLAIAERIATAIRLGQPFHAYIVLPVHPEGRLDDITIMGQIHWTMQSLVFADNSLINRIRRYIAAKALCKGKIISDATWKAACENASRRKAGRAPFEDVLEAEWSKYLTLLNLRTCERVGGVIRTEQVYIHSKLLIVDDRHVVLGSANINDRSQNGGRDSEIAMLLLGRNGAKEQMGTRKAHVDPRVRSLRKALWSKHFAVSSTNVLVKSVDGAKTLLDAPAAPSTYQEIQRVARSNALLYSKIFPHVPAVAPVNKIPATGTSIWPVCPANASVKDVLRMGSKMPFHEDFWKEENQLKKIGDVFEGFICALPVHWTTGQFNHPGDMSVTALTRNDVDFTMPRSTGVA